MIRPAPEKTSLSTRPHPGQLALKMLGCTCLLASLVLGCGSKQPKEEDYDLEIPTAEVLYEDGLEALKPKRVMLIFPYTNHQKAIDIFQEIVDNYPYSDYSIKAELQIANAYYDQKKWEEALSYYRDFGDLHPDDDQVPYALFQTGMCYSNQVSVPDRDQRATHYAVEAFQDLIDSYPDSGYAIEAVELEHALRVRLAENSFILADFYFETEEYQAASRRFEIMLIEYPDLGFDPLVLQRLGISYARLNRTEKSAAAFERLRTEYGVDERGVSVSAEAP
jgi:outer membrane protein assembly factor BamD